MKFILALLFVCQALAESPKRACDQGQKYREVIKFDEGCDRIKTIEECQIAARILGLPDTIAEDDRQTRKRYDPPYCYFEHKRLKFNADGTNYGKCSPFDKCLCGCGEPDPLTKPPPVTSPGGKYTLIVDTNHVCKHIKTIEECQEAAVALKLRDQTVRDDGHTGLGPRGPWRFDPPGCYLEIRYGGGGVRGSANLQFNKSGTNTGGCNHRDRCLCYA